jgi:glycerophosphoryl diester phosphodiesterase
MTTDFRAPERVAHRGVPRERTENTLPGFELAIEYGADAVELDVHATADGVVLVHHDFDVGGVAISATPWARLQDAELPMGARIPTLDAVLRAIGDRATVYIELKGRGIESRVAEVAQRAGHRYAVHSFDHGMIARCARAHADIPRGILLDRDVADPVEALAAALGKTLPRDVWPHHSLVDRRFMDAATAHGLRVIPWTVNSPDLARQLAGLGVAGICGDDVRMFARL